MPVTVKSLGCWQDSRRRRAIPGVEYILQKKYGYYSTRRNPIDICAQYAHEKGFSVFGVQNGGRCATSRTAGQTYYKHGKSNECREDGEGGPWANQVYQLVEIKDTTTAATTSMTSPRTSHMTTTQQDVTETDFDATTETSHHHQSSNRTLASNTTFQEFQTSIPVQHHLNTRTFKSSNEVLKIALPLASVAVITALILAVLYIRWRRKKSEKEEINTSGVTNVAYDASPARHTTYENLNFYENTVSNPHVEESIPVDEDDVYETYAGIADENSFYSNIYDSGRTISNEKEDRDNILYGQTTVGAISQVETHVEVTNVLYEAYR